MIVSSVMVQFRKSSCLGRSLRQGVEIDQVSSELLTIEVMLVSVLISQP